VSPPDNPAPVLPDFRDLASRIARTRSDFGRVYEEVRSAVPEATRQFLTISGGATSDQVAFERALGQAKEEGWFKELSERLIHDGFFPDESASVTELQALIKVELGFTDASVVERGGLRARSRLCRVEVAKGGNPTAVTGTGFLVGPSAVLTAFHVVATLVDDHTDAPVPGSERRLRVRFDHATGRRDGAEYKVPESWLVVRSRPHPAETATVTGIPQLVPPAGNVDLSGFLDYAVIVVAGSPGAERGYYDLDRVVEPKIGGTIHLFQHPMGVQQRQTLGEFRGFRDPHNRERIDHTANAEVGSSGGLLLDANYELVGLHQGAHGTPVVNTGISALAIRDHVQAQNANLLDSKYVQAFRLADDSRPILGRSKCQELIRRTSKPLVRVRPLIGGKGVSFTLEIMRACLPESEHVIGSVRVLELNSDAMRTAALLLDRLGVPAADLPTAPDANTSRGAWIGQLVASFGSRVKETHRDRTVWLLIDDLQKREHPIPDGSVRDFLSEVYTQSTNFENLRIVLLGMTDFPSGFPTGFVDDEDISPPQLADIVSYIRLRLTAGGIDHSVAEVDRFAMLIELTCGTDITSLSDYVADKVDRVLNIAIEALQ
jgi:Trypsin-like peptidase domain